MSASASTREVLERMGRAEAPEPRAAFVRDLEDRLARLIETAAEGDVVPEIELAPQPVAPVVSRRAMTTITAAFCALVLLVGVTTVRTGGVVESEVATDRLDSPIEAERWSARGMSSATDVTAGLEDATTSSTEPTVRDVQRARPAGSPRSPSTTAGSGDADASRNDALGGSDEASASASAPASAVAAGRSGPGPLQLEASGTAARVFLDWEEYDGHDFAAYLVLRASAPHEPSHPDASGRTLMLLRIENRAMTSHQDTPKVGTSPRYRVVVVSTDGSVVAQSDVVEPAMPLASSSDLSLAVPGKR